MTLGLCRAFAHTPPEDPLDPVLAAALLRLVPAALPPGKRAEVDRWEHLDEDQRRVLLWDLDGMAALLGC